MNVFYILDEDKNPISVSVEEYRAWRKDNPKHVAHDMINDHYVSTIFLFVDHAFSETAPILFETLVFDMANENIIFCRRYSTWKEAEEGHKEAAQWVKDGCKIE